MNTVRSSVTAERFFFFFFFYCLYLTRRIALVVRPEVVFLDEPTTGLDPRSRQGVWTLVQDLKNEGITVLLTTQYLEEADVLSDNIVVIDKGTVIAEGTADQLKERTGGSFCEVVPMRLEDLPRVYAVLDQPRPPGVHHRDRSTTGCRFPRSTAPRRWPRRCAGSTSPGSHWRTSHCADRRSTTSSWP